MPMASWFLMKMLYQYEQENTNIFRKNYASLWPYFALQELLVLESVNLFNCEINVKMVVKSF